jgi:transcriptional regulator GlxA family with amidase domain
VVAFPTLLSVLSIVRKCSLTFIQAEAASQLGLVQALGAGMNRKQVGILVFENIEVLDFCGPFEVFSVTRLNEEKRREESSPFNVFLVAEIKEPVVATGGMKVLPDYTLDDCPRLDVLVVPGGWGTRREMNNDRLLRWIGERSRQVETLTSVCTGALLLGKAGLLDGKRATTHWRSLDWMQELFPRTAVERQLHVVEDGTLLTSAGISAGIDMALKVVSRYFGEAIARATAKHMEYPFPDNNARRISLT